MQRVNLPVQNARKMIRNLITHPSFELWWCGRSVVPAFIRPASWVPKCTGGKREEEEGGEEEEEGASVVLVDERGGGGGRGRRVSGDDGGGIMRGGEEKNDHEGEGRGGGGGRDIHCPGKTRDIRILS